MRFFIATAAAALMSATAYAHPKENEILFPANGEANMDVRFFQDISGANHSRMIRVCLLKSPNATKIPSTELQSASDGHVGLSHHKCDDVAVSAETYTLHRDDAGHEVLMKWSYID